MKLSKKNEALNIIEPSYLASLSSLLWVALYYLPIGGALLRLILPLPIILLHLRRGTRTAFEGLILQFLLLFILMGPIRGTLFLFPYGILAFWLGWSWFKEKKKFDDKKNKKIKKVEKPKNVLENKKDINLEKENKKFDDKKNKKIKNLSKKRKIQLQSYKIIFILKDVDPKDPTEELSSILSNAEVNFEIEKIERILDSKNKSMDKN